MTNRTMILFWVLIAVAVIGATFIIFYHDQTNILIKQYTDKLSICGNITDEKVCHDNSLCKGIYGPSCPTCTDVVFSECKTISPADRAQTALTKNLCQKTAGRWQASITGDYCSCPSGQTFNSFQGCIKR